MDQSPSLGRRFVAILAALVSLAACSGNTPNTSKPKSPDTWWESEPKLAPKNFKQQVAETISIDGGEVTGEDVKVSIPTGALNEDAQLSIRKPLGKFGSEIGGPIVGLEHDKDLNGPIAVEWNVASLTPAQQRTLLIVRWNDKQQRWVPSPVEPNIADGILRAELTEWSFSSWIADRGQTGQEILGRRVDAPKCKDGKLHDWVRSVVDPDEETTAASVRVCFENDRDEIVTMRIANNRPFGQFIHMDGSSGWEWAWSGKSDVSAVQLVRTGAAAVFNNDNRIFVPPLQEVAVGIARPDTGGSHFIEFRNQYTTETILADVIMFAMSNVDVPAAGTEKVGVFVEALIECAFQGIVRGGPPTDLEATARSIVSSVVTCVGTITDETSELGLAFRTKLSKRIAEMSGPDAASDAIKHDRTLRRISGVFKLLVVAEIITYLNDLYQESRVGELRWSIRGNGTASPLGEWTPNCDNVSYDSNQIYRNIALQDEFADTSRELHEFPGWKAASTKAVAPLSTCPEDYLPKLSERVRTSWGDPKASAIIANAVELIGAKSPTIEELLSAEIPAMCTHEPTRLVDGKDVEVDEFYGYFELRRELMDGGSSWAQLPTTPAGPLTAIAAWCSGGGVGWPDPLMFFGPKGVYRFHTFLDEFDWEEYGFTGPGRNGIRNVTYENGRLIVELWVYQPEDPDCCATGYAIVALEILEGQARISSLIESGNVADKDAAATQIPPEECIIFTEDVEDAMNTTFRSPPQIIQGDTGLLCTWGLIEDGDTSSVLLALSDTTREPDCINDRDSDDGFSTEIVSATDLGEGACIRLHQTSDDNILNLEMAWVTVSFEADRGDRGAVLQVYGPEAGGPSPLGDAGLELAGLIVERTGGRA